MAGIAAAECRSMEEVRQEIDRIDGALVGLLAERQSYIERAATLKPERSAVRDDARIKDVISKVRATARATGLSQDIAEAVFRVLIERSIAHEFAAFDARPQRPR